MGIAVARSGLDSNTTNDLITNDLLLLFSVLTPIDFLPNWAVENLPPLRGGGGGKGEGMGGWGVDHGGD